MSYPERPWRARAIGRADPFAALEALQNRMARTFGVGFLGEREHGAWHPDVDVEETSDGWVAEVRLPGVAPEEVSVDVTERELVIRSRQFEGDDTGAAAGAAAETAAGAAAETAAPAEQAPMTGRSRRFREFSYRLSLPSDVDPEAIDATMDHGLLTVRPPRSARPRSRKIQIGRSTSGGVVDGTVTESGAAEPSGEVSPPSEDVPT